MIKELKKIISKTIRESNETNKYQKVVKKVQNNKNPIKITNLSY